ncbi:hypothetical protein [Yoonia tamlensis]|nr:hypothetical protein [Yoonia tamlensis]
MLQRMAIQSPVATKQAALQVAADEGRAPVQMAALTAQHTFDCAPVSSAAGDTLQRAVSVVNNGGTWTVSGRPAFIRTTVLTRYLVAEWNDTHADEPDQQLDASSVNLSDEELDRCHSRSWQEIRDDLVEAFLNGDIDQPYFEGSSDALYGSNPHLDFYANMVIARNAVLAGATTNNVKVLCGHLNSAPHNLRLDDSVTNRFIGAAADPRLRFDSDDEAEMSDDTEQNMAYSSQYAPMSPGGTTFYNSSAAHVWEHGRMPVSEIPPHQRPLLFPGYDSSSDSDS